MNTATPLPQRPRHPLFVILESPILRSLIAVGFLVASVAANPSTQEPDKPLSAHNTISGAEKQIQTMYAKFAEWEALVLSSAEAAQAGRRFPHQQLAKIFPETYRGIWYAKHLQAMGEPAGDDLERKFTRLRNAMRFFALSLTEFQAKEIATLTKETPNRRKTLAEVAELVDKGKLAEAERQLQTLHLKQLSSVFYLTNSQASPFENEVNSPHNDLLNRLNDQRRQEYKEKALAEAMGYADAVKTLQQESSRILNEFKQSPTAALAGGKPGDAADAINYIASLWGNASAAVSRSVAIAWAFNNGSAEATAQPFATVVTQIDSIANEALAEIINAAAVSAPNDQIPKLLPKILTELSVIDRRYLGNLDEEITASIGQLVQKNTELAGQVQRYSAATLEPSRWMERYATQQVDQLAKEYPVASNLLSRELTVETAAQPEIYGRGSAQTRLLTPGSLSSPANWVAADAKTLVGMKIREDGSLRISPTAKLAIVPQDPRHYANVPATFDIEQLLRELQEALLVDDQHGPLDLPAADALSSAELQEFRSLGGQIQRVTLEPFVCRFATLPDQAHALVPLNGLPNIDPQGNPIDKLIWRIDLQPDWVAHRLFFSRPQ